MARSMAKASSLVEWISCNPRWRRRNLRSLDECSHYSHMPRPFWQALAGFPAIGCAAPLPPLVYLQSLHKPIAVQLHCIIKKKGFSIGEKGVFPSVLTDAVRSVVSIGNSIWFGTTWAWVNHRLNFFAEVAAQCGKFVFFLWCCLSIFGQGCCSKQQNWEQMNVLCFWWLNIYASLCSLWYTLCLWISVPWVQLTFSLCSGFCACNICTYCSSIQKSIEASLWQDLGQKALHCKQTGQQKVMVSLDETRQAGFDEEYSCVYAQR